MLAFGPDGGTGHPDHIAVSGWVTRAVERAALGSTRLLYATKTAWADLFRSVLDPSTVMMVEEFEPEVTQESDLAVWFTCDPQQLVRKVAAMRAQESQLEGFYQMLGPEAFDALVREEFFCVPEVAPHRLV